MELSQQTEDAAYGPGTDEAMIGARLANPVPARLDWNSGASLRDAEVKRLHDIRVAAVAGIADWARWIQRETWPHGKPRPAQEA